ncbi:DegT/DnrJ/EryC1/StrS family aminotransferase [Thioclava nitratireducens]|uniref:DegT/DnrJ/EryC1/StrS family aminotransferase n=1 Tax=Thioclava nitratireducens TaxID=1915078 RepID=UPI0024805143|nr:aminotransferase class I/II-fold pyridoxal phosphate-dependent enzyme [Thioclava nitratireducens]WGT50736.1 aminotransferase class I/II-fold pyridoxal phosphate-dependent enzyme [Thioclava nitratireducens]
MSEVFNGNFTQQEPIPEEAIERAVEVMRSGRLHRYNTVPGEPGEVALLEEEFAGLTGAPYCLAVASGGYALGCALRAVGVGPGDPVLTNAFTLAPVPGAIAAVGGKPVLVEVTDQLTIDLDDLAAKAPQARVLMLSHMRGHICDMDALMEIARTHDLTVIEDCAHTMGAAWGGVPSGRHGAIGCYSTQTYKHMNSGEGGLIVTDDAELAARMILLSGSYMLYERHRAAPRPEVFEGLKYDTPNVSGRMDNLRAAILRPQLPTLADRVARWNALYREIEAGLAGAEGVALIERPEAESYAGSSFQFRLPGRSAPEMLDFVARAAARGVELKWFGADEPAGFTSRHDSWRYAEAQNLPRTDAVLATLLDLRLPLTFSTDDAAQIARILREEAAR